MGILEPFYGLAAFRLARHLLLVAASCCLAGCISIPGVEYGAVQKKQTKGTLDGSHDPALATVQITGVVVGFVGNGLIVENHSAQSLKSVVIVVNEGDELGEYRFRVAEMGPHTTNTYLAQVFRNDAGESLNAATIKVRKFALYADTLDGRGVWRGAY